jgi:hypothetical protein
MNRVIQSTKMLIDYQGIETEVFIDGWVLFTTDTRWGEDADGNRGTAWTLVDDVEGVSAVDIFSNPIDLTAEQMEMAKQNLADAFLTGSA